MYANAFKILSNGVDMSYKTIACHIATIFLLSIVCIATAAAQTSYYYFGYMAQTAPYQYKHIYEKNIIAIDDDSNLVRNRLKDDYVAFIKSKHPEYYKAHIIGHSDPKYVDFIIRSKATISGPYSEVRYARSAQKQEINDRKQRFAQDVKNGPVIESDEYSYSP